MADFYHGVKTSQQATAVSTPLTAASGVPFVVGTAPVHMVQGKTNEMVFCTSYADAVSALGYSDDWDKYSLCEVMDVHFKQYGMSPVIFVNVLDASAHKHTVAEAQHTLESGKLKLPLEALQDTVTVKNSDGTVTYTVEMDYTLFYSGGYLVLEVLDGGAIADAGTTLTIGYDAVTPEGITKADIIGGFDTSTKKSTGFELIDKVFAKCLLTPDLLLAPGWSHDSEVAAVMAAKAESINGLFEAKALIDADTETVQHYTDVNEWRTKNNITAKEQIVFWPQVALSGKVYHASVHAAALMAQVDTDNGGCPCESPSNKALKIDSTVLADGTEMLLDIAEANHLNSCGIVTALNFIGGFGQLQRLLSIEHRREGLLYSRIAYLCMGGIERGTDPLV